MLRLNHMPTSRSFAQWIIVVLASQWFFPVSCTTAMGLGMKILADLDARDVARGESGNPVKTLAMRYEAWKKAGSKRTAAPGPTLYKPAG